MSYRTKESYNCGLRPRSRDAERQRASIPASGTGVQQVIQSLQQPSIHSLVFYVNNSVRKNKRVEMLDVTTLTSYMVDTVRQEAEETTQEGGLSPWRAQPCPTLK